MEGLFIEFRQIIKTTKIIYVKLPGSNRIQPTRLERIDVKGSKIAYSMDIDDTRALLIGNTDFQNPYPYWPGMVEAETKISSRLQEAGLLTTNNRRTTIYLDPELTKGLPAYFSDKFSYLASQRKYVLDTKNYETTPWKGNFFSSEEEMMINIGKWRQLLQSFFKDIDRMYQLSIPRGGDCVNYIVIQDKFGYSLRYFGFDFASKTGNCLECKYQDLDLSSSEYRLYKHCHIRRAIEFIIFQEYEGWGTPKFCTDSQQIKAIVDQIYPLPLDDMIC